MHKHINRLEFLLVQHLKTTDEKETARLTAMISSFCTFHHHPEVAEGTNCFCSTANDLNVICK
jgi:hypothetical protein